MNKQVPIYNLFIFLFIISFNAWGETAPTTALIRMVLDSGFVESSLPKERNGYLYRVESESGKLKVKQSECPKVNKQIEFKGKRIRYAGSNYGEFGGNLTAYFPDGTSSLLIDKNIVAIVPDRNHPKIWVFTGLTHMIFSSGNVYTIENYDSNPIVKHITLLPDAPVGVFPRIVNNQVSEDFYILGFRSLMLLMTHEPEILTIETINDWEIWRTHTVFQKDQEFLFGICGAFIYFRSMEIGGLAPHLVKFYVPETAAQNRLLR